MLGIFKSVFGKSDGNPYEKFSTEDLLKQRTQREEKVAELKRKLPTEAMQVGQEKSEAWQTQMRAKIEAAQGKGLLNEVIALEKELKAGSKVTGRVSQHAEELKQAILAEEDQLELIERVLDTRK